jgi:hypothetical protein
MVGANPLIPSAFNSFQDGLLRQGKRPVVFDILAPDKETSILPNEVKLVLHVNPRSMNLQYNKLVSRTQTRGGFVEQHWGDALEQITFEGATGGFVRLYAGLSNKAGSSGAGNLQGNGSELTAVQGRRETIAYDRYLDMLALFKGNGAVYDANGAIAIQGYLQVSFDEGVYIGWFDTDFTVTEDASQPYQFRMNSRFIIEEERLSFRTTVLNAQSNSLSGFGQQPANQPIFPAANFGGFFSEP